jgi:polyisoprenyl-phosphate glycosyltransferase
MSEVRFSIVIPCYNEEKNIPLVLKRFAEVVNRDDVEVILVDNGSTDGSAGVLASLLPAHDFARMVKVAKNQGYGFGILSGLKEARGEFIGWTHADMQTDPQDVMRAFSLIEENGSSPMLYVKGWRQGRSLFDNAFSYAMAAFETVYMRQFMCEINAQPNIFHRSFFQKWRQPPHDFALDLYAYFLAKKMRLNMIRMRVRFPERIHGQSSWNTSFAAKWKFIKRTVAFSLNLKKQLNHD